MMFKVKSNIGDVPVCENVNGIVYYADGTVIKNSKTCSCLGYTEFIKTDNHLYLNFNKVITGINYNDNEVVFDKELITSLQFDLNTRELIVLNENNLGGIERTLRQVTNYVSKANTFNEANIRKFVFGMLSSEYFFEEFIKKVDISYLERFYETIIRLYLIKNISLIEFLVKNNFINCFKEIFTDEFDTAYLNELKELNKEIIYKFCNLFNGCKEKYLSTLLYANSNMDRNELELLYKFIEMCIYLEPHQNWSKISIVDLMTKLTDIKLVTDRFVNAINTLSKEIFKNFRYDKVSDVVTEYRDYLLSIEEMNSNLTKYPKNIAVAHKEAISRLKIYREENGVLKNSDFNTTLKFKKAVSKYKHLEYKGKEFEVIAPSNQSDLIKEGDKLSHCVGSYIPYILSERSKILFCRRADDIDTPYMTLEIMGTSIKQAKKYNNATPSIEDREFLNEFCLEKGLVISNY